MKDAVARSVMLDYARSEHSDENLLFYDQAASFRRTFVRRENEPALHATDVEQMRKEAEKIVKEVCAPTFLRNTHHKLSHSSIQP